MRVEAEDTSEEPAMRDRIRSFLLPMSLLGMMAGLWSVAWVDANTNFASYLAGETSQVQRTDNAPLIMSVDRGDAAEFGLDLDAT